MGINKNKREIEGNREGILHGETVVFVGEKLILFPVEVGRILLLFILLLLDFILLDFTLLVLVLFAVEEVAFLVELVGGGSRPVGRLVGKEKGSPREPERVMVMNWGRHWDNEMRERIGMRIFIFGVGWEDGRDERKKLV